LLSISSGFGLTDFFSTFVRNLNFNKFIGLTVGLDVHGIPAQQQASTVTCNSK
jgi:hypothetical protein